MNNNNKFCSIMCLIFLHIVFLYSAQVIKKDSFIIKAYNNIKKFKEKKPCLFYGTCCAVSVGVFFLIKKLRPKQELQQQLGQQKLLFNQDEWQ